MKTAVRAPQSGVLFGIARLACVAILLAACGSGRPQRVEVVGRPAPARPVLLHVADTLVVRLPANPSTGYAWQRLARPAVLKLVDSMTTTPAAGDRVGAPAEQLFRFVATASGRADLSFHYRRPWESQVPAADSVRMTVLVEER